MSNEIPLHDFSPSQPGGLPLEIIRLESLPKIATRPLPNRHTFYELFWITDGVGTHSIDFEEYAVRPEMLIFLAAGQVHYWKEIANLKGFVILFGPDIVLHLNEGVVSEQFNPLALSRRQAVHYLQGDLAEHMGILWNLLYDEYAQNKPLRSASLVALLQLILVQLYRLDNSAIIGMDKPSAVHAINRAFQELVAKSAMKEYRVEWYARELGVTVAHLSKSIKIATGETAGSLLRKQRILEAKRLLVNTELNISEVATMLEFKDPSYFSRYFKRETQTLPAEFRNQFPLTTRH